MKTSRKVAFLGVVMAAFAAGVHAQDVTTLQQITVTPEPQQLRDVALTTLTPQAQELVLQAADFLELYGCPAHRPGVRVLKMTIYVGAPPRDFVGPMPYFQVPGSPLKLYYVGPSILLNGAHNPTAEKYIVEVKYPRQD